MTLSQFNHLDPKLREQPVPPATAEGAHFSEAEFESLFRTYYSRVSRYFRKKDIDPESAEELTQDTFLRVFRGRGSFSDAAELEAWLFKIARNVYRNEMRDRRAEKRQGIAVPIDDAESTAAENEASLQQQQEQDDDPLDRYLTEQRKLRLRQAVSELPTQMRACMLLRIHHNYRYREIAERLRLSIQTVKAHLYQARKRLQAELSNDFDRIDF